jgi:hypothetical protein
MRKFITIVFLPVCLVSFLSAQSLAELAKKEKARRESLKGKNVKLVTNADLSKGTRKPSLEVVEPTEPVTGSNPSQSAPAPRMQPPQEIASPPPPASGALEAKEYEAQKKQLESRMKQTEEMVDLLQTKLAGLWQEFYSMNDMKTKDKIQLDISDFYAKLLTAQDEAAAARKDLEDFLKTVR